MLLLPVLLTGALAGLLAGMLGIGGGLVIVPALAWLYAARDFPPDAIMQMALATSLASILFTGASAVRAHQRRGAVRWDLVRRLAPALVVGALAGTYLAEAIGSAGLQHLFGAFAAALGVRMLLAGAADAGETAAERPAGRGLHLLAGGGIGIASALFGIGGGSLTVPYLSALRVRMQEAVATSSACGLPIALAGTAGFVWVGLDHAALPSASLGYVHLPSLAALAVASVPMAALGARLAHRLEGRRLRQVFAVVLLLVAAEFLWPG